MTLEEIIRQRALELGFDALGIAHADVPLTIEFERYEAYLEEGRNGAMPWLAENRETRRRLDTSDILEGARSVLCVAVRYGRDEPELPPDSIAAVVARYARGQDYHNVIRKKLRKLAAFVRTLGEGVEARPMIDTAPVLERAWAARSGLGFIGKNSLLIIPGQGSFLLIGEVVTTLALVPGTPMNERCGSCTRCLDACPTDAFPAPFQVDARRCISALTIEQRGPIDEPLRSTIGDHLFGCDICQEVCPFNRARPAPAEKTQIFAPLERWQTMTPEQLLEEADLEGLRKGSPLYRCPPAETLRNAILILLHRHATSARPAILRIAEAYPEPWLRELALQAAAELAAEDKPGG